ncbi:alanine dehydrogenase [Lentilactobacillus senioris]|uniref:Alanine dehydrogenase n=1 Tax=Lentilactobacillus senioris DSM 24302 = JCM 17472 TaxID=1423802 RepID=A0A0R2CRN6_9LACO|nr:alanine dehydrogenase [Lentilactobacillus senioris]KRM94447.1 alanine dehydrogenase [Lentilactobacillus senioris DSM 24302 = JCM 17472]
MKISVVKELKEGEGRVAETPENVKKLVDAGNEVLVDNNAGIGSGFTNEEYEAAGAKIVTPEEAWSADLVLKVKEPDKAEYKYFTEGKVVWGFQHLASSKETVEAMMKAGTTAIGAETIFIDGKLALLAPMSAIAGRRSVLQGAAYLEAEHGGEGILLPGLPQFGIPAGYVVIFGGGSAATNAADMALGIGCHVSIIEKNPDRIKWLEENYSGQDVTVLESNDDTLSSEIKKADLFISTILIPGARPPKLVTEEMVKSMKPGSVIVDVAIDQGGTVETMHPTTIDEPTYIKHGVVHYGVPNQPGAVPRTATMGLAAGNIDFLLEIGERGIVDAIKTDEALASGVNVYEGKVTNEGLAKSLDLPYVDLNSVL